MFKKKIQLGTITIMLGDRNSHAQEVNKLLGEAGHLIIARLGVNVERTHVDHCSALITVVVEGGKTEISDLTKKLDKLYGVIAKASIVTEK
jgi:metal-responsive CopG/Arc/MetJ family transcriptional regulator